MKTSLICLTLLFSVSSFAKAKSAAILDVQFEKNKLSHRYQIVKTLTKEPTYKLSFTDEKKKVKSISLSRSQADQMRNEANRIVWQNAYRTPASKGSCRLYMTIKTDIDKTSICQEKVASVGKAYGFIHSLSEMMK